MAKTKPERIAEIEQMIERLRRRRMELLQSHKVQERKARAHRLCKRSGYLEKMLPELAALTDEQFEVFVKKTLLTDFAKKALRGLASSAQKPEMSEGGNALPAQEEKQTATQSHKRHQTMATHSQLLTANPQRLPDSRTQPYHSKGALIYHKGKPLWYRAPRWGHFVPAGTKSTHNARRRRDRWLYSIRTSKSSAAARASRRSPPPRIVPAW